MKKLLLVILMLSMGWQGFNAFADGDNGDKDSKPISNPITIVTLPADIPGAPRAVVPIACEYNTVAKSIMITFFADLSYVDVMVQNNTTGEYISGTLNSADGFAVIPFNVTGGSYSIVFWVAGEMMGGTFEL